MKYLKIILFCAICMPVLSAGLAFAYQNPVANAGPDLYVTSGGFTSNPSAILQGSATDPNGGTLSFFWSCDGGTLSNNSVLQPLFTAPSNMWQSAIHTCTLTVTDNYGLSASDSATIYVNYNNNNNYNYNLSIQTNPATNNSNGQATLNAAVTNSGNLYGAVYAWFQWGTDTSYGYESSHKPIAYAGPFDQHIANLLPGTTYHFRAVAQQNNNTPVYGQDLTFNTPGTAAIVVSAPPVQSQVLGASAVSTGLTNNFLTDSFFLPLMLILLMSWLYFTGRIYRFADWLSIKIK